MDNRQCTAVYPLQVTHLHRLLDTRLLHHSLLQVRPTALHLRSRVRQPAEHPLGLDEAGMALPVLLTPRHLLNIPPLLPSSPLHHHPSLHLHRLIRRLLRLMVVRVPETGRRLILPHLQLTARQVQWVVSHLRNTVLRAPGTVRQVRRFRLQVRRTVQQALRPSKLPVRGILPPVLNFLPRRLPTLLPVQLIHLQVPNIHLLVLPTVRRRRLTARHLRRTEVLPPTAVQLNSKTVRRDLDGEIQEGTAHRRAGRAKSRVERFSNTPMKQGGTCGGKLYCIRTKNRGRARDGV